MPISKAPFEETMVYECKVTLSVAKGQSTPSTTEFHNALYDALRDYFNKPMTPFYVSEVSVIDKKEWRASE